MKLKGLPPLKNVPRMSVPSANGHDLCPIVLICCRIMIGNI